MTKTIVPYFSLFVMPYNDPPGSAGASLKGPNNVVLPLRASSMACNGAVRGRERSVEDLEPCAEGGRRVNLAAWGNRN